MKIEIADVAVVLLALFMLAAYFRLGNIAFIYVFVVLAAAELFVQLKFRKTHEEKEPESLE